MIRSIVTATIILAAAASQAAAVELTAADVRGMIASVGINPGTAKALGPFGVQVIREVDVSQGRRKGDFVIRLRIVPRSPERR